MKKVFTVTVGVPAYNEELNIGNLLSSILSQKHESFNVKDILVYSDGSNDYTNNIVSKMSLKHPVIKLLKGKARKGKYYRINQLFRKCKTDFLIILDADIALDGNLFIDKLISKLITNPKAQLVAAHNIMIRPNTFLGKIIYAELMIWESVRFSLPSYDSPLNFYGSASAYRGSFVRSTVIPSNLQDPHLYIYLAAKKLNGFAYCLDAEVMQWSISTLDDLKKLLRRSIGKKDKKLEKIFKVNMDQLFFVSRRVKIKGILKAFNRQPFYTILAILLDVFLTKLYHPQNVNKTPVWDILASTKKPISYEKQ